MKTNQKRIKILVCILLIIVAIATQVKAAATPSELIKPEQKVTGLKFKYLIPLNQKKIKFTELGKPRALDQYWEKIAWCETHQDWQNPGRFAGGLGIMTSSKYGERSMGTWERWGGEEFAESPDKATKKQQILVANRISSQGWYQPDGKYKKPVSFYGWGCAKRYAYPELFTESPYPALFKNYTLNQQSEDVKLVQRIIGGLRVDGVYGIKTQFAHIMFMAKHGTQMYLEVIKYG